MTAVAIFVKTPGLSPIKTRLARGIGARAAAEFHRRAATCVAAAARAAMPELVPYWAVAEKQGHRFWQGFPTLWQGGNDLGCRMAHVYAGLLARHGRVLLIGADIPQVSSSLLLQAAEVIRAPRAAYALGPARDGGFWLFGGTRPVPLETWLSVPYSRGDTCQRMASALQPLGAIAWLPVLADADDLSGLPLVQSALQAANPPLPEQASLARWLGAVLRGKITEADDRGTRIRS